MINKNFKKLFVSTLIALFVFGASVSIYYFSAYRIVDGHLINKQPQSVVMEDDIESDLHSSFFVNKKTNADYVEENGVYNGIYNVTHIPTPDSVKGLYMTSWVAGTDNLRDNVINIVDNTEVNSVVVDLKDYSGKISYLVDDPDLRAIGSVEKRISNLKGLTGLLHSKGIYVIGRIACFQDAYFTKLHPEYAIKTDLNKNLVWTDKKGLSWLDPGEQNVWDYLIAISKDAYAQGVDEIQFDYTRFPSDGNMKDIYYPISQGKKRADVINDFWVYLNKNLHNTGPIISVDLFGLTATDNDDLGIGQFLENALRNFDYVSPMVYPSHYAPNWNNYKDPQDHPYEVVKFSMSTAVLRAKVIDEPPSKLRPWLQDFGLFGKKYGPKEVRDQISAVSDSGLNSWLLWDASSNFTVKALLP